MAWQESLGSGSNLGNCTSRMFRRRLWSGHHMPEIFLCEFMAGSQHTKNFSKQAQICAFQEWLKICPHRQIFNFCLALCLNSTLRISTGFKTGSCLHAVGSLAKITMDSLCLQSRFVLEKIKKCRISLYDHKQTKLLSKRCNQHYATKIAVYTLLRMDGIHITSHDPLSSTLEGLITRK